MPRTDAMFPKVPGESLEIGALHNCQGMRAGSIPIGLSILPLVFLSLKKFIVKISFDYRYNRAANSAKHA
jgi:hypothetical protein